MLYFNCGSNKAGRFFKKPENALQKQMKNPIRAPPPSPANPQALILVLIFSLKGRLLGRNNYFWEGIFEDQKEIILLLILVYLSTFATHVFT